MRLIPLYAAAALLLVACDGTKPPAPTTIQLSTQSVTFDAVGATRQLSATVLDGEGRVMENAEVTWTSNTPAASVTPSATSSRSAQLRSTGSGSGTVTVKSGNATATVNIDVSQAPTIVNLGGDMQVAQVGTPLPVDIEAIVLDRLGAPIAGLPVAFAVASGGGSVSAPSATTGADGKARVRWTLGTTTSEEQRVSATAGALVKVFRATALPGSPASFVKHAGDAQTGYAGAPLDTAPAVRVLDSYGNPVSGAEVVFSTTDGIATGRTQTTNLLGIARVGSWTLGTTPGPMSMSATATALGTTVVFTATAVQGAPAVTLSMGGGDNQIGIEGRPLGRSPSIIVRNAAGEPVAGRAVTFTVTEGGGSVSASTALSDANGVATVAWTLGATASSNRLRASVSGGPVTNNDIVFSATGCTGGPEAGFTINVCFMSPVTASQRATFVGAAARWGQIITGNLSPVATAVENVACGAASASLHFTIDDLVIYASIVPIDGPGQVLGSAGWCYRREGGLPVLGAMRFDEADVATLEANGRFNDVILHEMGHVLGIGTMWTAVGMLQNPSPVGGPPNDTHFNGQHAIAGFDQIGGLSYTAGAKVPVENAAGAGSINGHWRESVLGTELMTPFLNSGVANPLTVLTIGSLRDLGYEVDLTRADPQVMFELRAGTTAGKPIDLRNDILGGPKFTIDQQGRIKRIQ